MYVQAKTYNAETQGTGWFFNLLVQKRTIQEMS
jgi:hypothetical protein